MPNQLIVLPDLAVSPAFTTLPLLYHLVFHGYAKQVPIAFVNQPWEEVMAHKTEEVPCILFLETNHKGLSYM